MLQVQINSPPSEVTSSHPDTRIAALLLQYANLFLAPTGLPPPRSIDHHIPLLEGSNPVNVRPYRYPQFQKREIESQIREMLANGIIQPSSSAFSSPVLLVRKKDGCWRFCVDYRALNALTTRIGFPFLPLMSSWMNYTVPNSLASLICARVTIKSVWHHQMCIAPLFELIKAITNFW
jgi:hypothetical protein